MKKKILSVLLATVLTAAAASAQQPYAAVLQQIEQNSATLAALRAEADARRVAGRTGLTPADPEVEFGYLWGHPAAGGDRKDVSLRQTFDLPTVYRQRGRLADVRDRGVESEYRTQRMELLLEAERTCIELVYQNALAALYATEADRVRQATEAYGRLLEAGEANQLDYNKAMLHRVQTEHKEQRIRLERERLASELTAANGGQPIAFDRADYEPHPALPDDFEGWYAAAEAGYPALQYLKAQVEVADREISLARAETLPKLSVGYMGEFVPGQRYQGVTAGISLPLWENKNRVRQTQAEARVAEQLMDDARLRYYRHLYTLYAQARELATAVERYNSLLAEHDNAELLLKAFELGELSLPAYLQELEYGLTVRVARLEAQRDLELVRAELEAFRL